MLQVLHADVEWFYFAVLIGGFYSYRLYHQIVHLSEVSFDNEDCVSPVVDVCLYCNCGNSLLNMRCDGCDAEIVIEDRQWELCQDCWNVYCKSCWPSCGRGNGMDIYWNPLYICEYCLAERLKQR